MPFSAAIKISERHNKKRDQLARTCTTHKRSTCTALKGVQNHSTTSLLLPIHAFVGVRATTRAFSTATVAARFVAAFDFGRHVQRHLLHHQVVFNLNIHWQRVGGTEQCDRQAHRQHRNSTTANHGEFKQRPQLPAIVEKNVKSCQRRPIE